jgi:hypothetical protein
MPRQYKLTFSSVESVRTYALNERLSFRGKEVARSLFKGLSVVIHQASQAKSLGELKAALLYFANDKTQDTRVRKVYRFYAERIVLPEGEVVPEFKWPEPSPKWDR